MALELVTGYWGQNHVTAEQEADLNAGIFGSGFYVLPVGEKMRAEAVTSNQVRIFDGIFLGYGRQASIEEGGYENVTIENGTAGLLRNDMIVVKYNKDEESGIESVAFDVLKGQTGPTAQDPVPNNQDIRAGAFESEMPLYRVKLNGLAIEAIEPLFMVPKSIPELMQDISDLEDENGALNSALAPLSGITSSLTSGGVEFTSRVYSEGDVHVDGKVSAYQCEIMYMRLYSQSDRSLLIGTMVSSADPDWWDKYVASATLLVTKNLGAEWYGWVSLATSVAHSAKI